MMKCLLLSVAMVCAGFSAIESKAQAPAIDWQASYGGTWYDFVTNISPTTDGGYILSATSSSDISGEKTVASYGSEDYWIIKIDAFGTIEWQKAYGGSGSDVAIHVEQTADGGYIIGGYSSSGIGGNKTVSTYGSNDCWIIKTNASGTIEWQKTLGGTGYEIFYAVHQTSDGGYIVGADSESGFSGNKTEASLGGKDYWIVKLDASGNISWQNAIGGSGSDLFADINITSDGGFIIGGNSTSGITGDKTENSNGGNDFWVLKLSSTGNIQWQNTIGGSSDDALYYCFETGDGGYFIGGSSASEISGDKTEPQFGDIIGMPDMWVMKLNNSGLIEWQNTIGGNRGDIAYAGAEKSDGTFVIAGNSSTGVNGDKTEPAFGAAGITDYWTLHLDETGNILWQRTLGGEASEVLFCVAITPDGGCMLGGASWSGATGNKTTLLQGNDDAWVVKLDPDCMPTIETCNAIDDNCNGIIDDGVVESITISAGGATTVCQGTPVVLTASHTGTSLQWKRNDVNIIGATSLTYSATQTGNYTCTTTSDCDTTTSSTIAVTANKNPKAVITAGGPTTFCAGGSVTLSEAPSGGCTYQWYKGGSAIAGATSTSYVVTTAGNYKCRVTKTATGCFKNSNPILVAITCKEGEDLSGNQSLQIFPNPASNSINLSQDSCSSGMVFIYTQSGALVQSIQNWQGESISVADNASGMYFIRVISGDISYSGYFVKE